MDDREKIISIIRPIIKEQYLMRCKEPDGCDNCWISCSVNERAKALADALVAANIGDVTEYKKTIRDLNTDVVAYRALSKADTLEQIIEGQKSLIDEYKHRAEVADRALMYAVSEYRCDECPCAECNAEIRGSQECIELICAEHIQQAEREIAEEKGE